MYEETFVKMQFGKMPTSAIARALNKNEEDIKLKAIDFGLLKEEKLIPQQMTIELPDVKIVKKPKKCPVRYTKDGVLIYIPEHPRASCYGYVFEHRLVMEKHIGRYLYDNEVVYRKDGNKRNNSIDNLYVKELTFTAKAIREKHGSKPKVNNNIPNTNHKTVYQVIKDSGYNIDGKKNTGLRTTFLDKAYIYFRNKGYDKQYIMRVLKISSSYYRFIRDRNVNYIYYKKPLKVDELSLEMIQRLMKKRGVKYRTIKKKFNLSGQLIKEIYNKYTVE
jgi:hypothetical protein